MSFNRGELLFISVCLAGTVAALWACAPLRAQNRLNYPAAPRGPVSEDYSGTRVADPYRWLEDLDSPATRAWVQAQADLTRQYLDGIPELPRLRARIATLYDFEKTGIPFREGGREFFTTNSGRQDQSVLMSTQRPGEAPVVTLDPNLLPAADHPVVTGYVASHDGRLLAYAIAPSGSDWTEWRIRDLASGQDLPDVLRYTKYYAPVFTPDGKGVYYSAFAAPRAGQELSAQDLGNAVYSHALGPPPTADVRLMSDAGHPERQYLPHLSPDGLWLVVLAGEGEVGDKGREDVYLLDLKGPAGAAPSALSSGFAAAFIYIGADGGRLYFLTSLHAPNGRVVALNPEHAAGALWQEVIPEGKEAIDLSVGAKAVTLVGHQLLVKTLHDAHSRLISYDLDGTMLREAA